ncbi:TIGR03086 family metal-binding protein [Streptomyces sp. NPDC087300]|uniref:TIGR03086 family metal-binding protein n=1 Tax=Streptomyces sp. NPDC087300 TaxID=3365780 RepID=UPI00380ABD07
MDATRGVDAAGDADKVGDLIAVAAARAVPVVHAIPDGRLGAPTPCADYDVRALVNHLLQVVVQFQELAAKRDSDFSAVPDYVGEGSGEWRARFEGEAGRLVAAWGEPGADEGTTGAMDMPAATVGCMVLLDLTVHAWDLARATGQELPAVDERVLRRLAEAVEGMAPMARKMGVFGEPVAVREGASGFERLLAATGRDPYWGSGE